MVRKIEMIYYTEVIAKHYPFKPKNRIDYCFKCRILELYCESSQKFQKLDTQYHDLFQSYLTGAVSKESSIRDVLRNAKLNFKLNTSTYLVHKYNGETFSRDIINGIRAGRYDGESKFCIIDKYGGVYEHSVSGCHMTGEIGFIHNEWPRDFAYYANDLINKGEIDLSKYGEDFMECTSTYTGESPKHFRMVLLEEGVEFPFETLCRIAATDAEILRDIIFSYDHSEYTLDITKRNIDIGSNCSRIHPDHKRIGLNLADILVLLNPNPIIQIRRLMPKTNKEDIQLFVKSLKFWLENVQNEREYELVRNHVKCLEKDGYVINLFD